MAYYTEIEVNPSCPLPPPGKAYVRYMNRTGLIFQSMTPEYQMVAWERAKNLLAQGYKVWYTHVLTTEGV